MLLFLSLMVTLPIGLFLLAAIRLLTLSPPTAVDSANFEIDVLRFKPMERLLRQEDLRYLAAQGIETRSINRLRAERRAIFRKYLRSLQVDFARITAMVRLAMVESCEPRPELAATLVRARIFFAYTVVLMEARLLLHAIGWSGITINVQPAIAALSHMRDEWETMVPSAA